MVNPWKQQDTENHGRREVESGNYLKEIARCRKKNSAIRRRA
jgi:hypothetical protein